MRKTVSLLAICVVAKVSAFGQGNLQFNQVKLVGSTQETVPVGKVWKVESAVLSKKDGIRQQPSFQIGQDTAILGYDSYYSRDVENVVSITLDIKGTCCVLPITRFNIHLDGNQAGGGIMNRDIPIPDCNAVTSSFTTIGTVACTSPGNNVVNNYALSFTPPANPTGCTAGSAKATRNFTLRVRFNMANGQSISYNHISIYSAGNCLTCNPISGMTSSSTQTNTISSTTVERNITETKFPIWLPAGTPLKTLSNISKLS